MTEKNTSSTSTARSLCGKTRGRIIERLKARGAPLAPDQIWSTYVGTEVFDGHVLSFDGTSEERKTLREMVRLSETERLTFVICVPKEPHYVGRLTSSLRAGFTVVSDDDGTPILYQSVMYADLGDNAVTVADTPTATYVVVPVNRVSAWDTSTSRKTVSRILH